MTQPRKRIRSIFGSPYETYFHNGDPNPSGDLLAAGRGLPTRRSDWWDTREMWTFPHYSLNMMIGEGRASYRNEDGFQCELAPGTFFFNFPHFKQQYAPALNECWGELFVSFAGELFDLVRKQEIITPRKPVWRLARPGPWANRLQALLQRPLPATPSESQHRAIHFLDFLLAMLEKATPVQASPPETDWFTRACQMLTGDLHHQVNLHHIADELAMSYNTFRVYFTRRAGMAPIQYRNQVRIQRACHLLLSDRKKSCREIAFSLCYNSPQHFSAQIKKHTGLSPEQYRRKSRK